MAGISQAAGRSDLRRCQPRRRRRVRRLQELLEEPEERRFMCGDDWCTSWHGVICAVNRFSREKQLNLQIGGNTWVMQKTLSAEQQVVLSVMTQELNKLKQVAPMRVAM